MQIEVARMYLILLIDARIRAWNGTVDTHTQYLNERKVHVTFDRSVYVCIHSTMLNTMRMRRPLASLQKHANRILNTRAHTSIPTNDNINRVMCSLCSEYSKSVHLNFDTNCPCMMCLCYVAAVHYTNYFT